MGRFWHLQAKASIHTFPVSILAEMIEPELSWAIELEVLERVIVREKSSLFRPFRPTFEVLAFVKLRAREGLREVALGLLGDVIRVGRRESP